MPTTRKHYEANIAVTRVTRTLAETKIYNEITRVSDVVEQEAGRDSREIAVLKFSASTPKRLSEKIAAHIALITDGEVDAGS